MKNTIVTFLLSVLACSFSFAEGLSTKSIEKWLKAYPEVSQWMDKHEDQLDIPEPEIGEDNMDMSQYMKDSFEMVKKHELYPKFEKLIKPLGYSSGDALFADTVAIVKTFVAANVKMEMDKSGVKDMLSKLDELDQMPLDENQKAMMKEQMMGAIGQVKAMLAMVDSVPQVDIETITPYLEKIGALMEK
jgi:hypothetical protein